MEAADKAIFYKTLKAFLYTLNGTATPMQESMIHYWEALKGFDVEKVCKALNELARDGNAHIPPALVVAKITGKKPQRAKDEFDVLLGLVKKHGVSGAKDHVDLKSKTWEILKSVGGFGALNTSDISQVRAAFYQAWDK